jgi:hypothetical protein
VEHPGQRRRRQHPRHGGQLDGQHRQHEVADGRRGRFGADVKLAGANVAAKKTALGWAKIANNLTGSEWEVDHNMGKLTVTGTALNSTVQSAGTMTGLKLGAADGSDFLAGIADGVEDYAKTGADFENADARIKSIAIAGWRIAKGDPIPRFLTDSNFSAATIGPANVRNADEAESSGLHVLRREVGGLEQISSLRYKDTLTGESWSWRPGQPSPVVPYLIIIGIDP